MLLSMHHSIAVTSLSIEPFPLSFNTLTEYISVSGAIPTNPKLLSLAAIIPAIAVPCPTLSFEVDDVLFIALYSPLIFPFRSLCSLSIPLSNTATLIFSFPLKPHIELALIFSTPHGTSCTKL